jgi:hypothetical protein
MPKTTEGELPDVDPETLNAMIRDIARQMGCPYWASPDLVELDHIPTRVYGLNVGCKRTGLDEYKEGQRWRRKALEELKRCPEWARAWLAAAEMDRRVRELCDQKGLTFGPWETAPWQVQADNEPPVLRGGFEMLDSTAALAIRLRRQLEAELGRA